MMKKIGDLTVNDGKGLMDNDGLIDSLIEDLNNLLKSGAAGQYIRVSSLAVGMVQKLQNLRKAIADDRKSLLDQMADLEKLNNELAEKAFNLPVDGAEETEN